MINYIYNQMVYFTRIEDFTWRCARLWRISGVTYRGWWGGYFDFNIYDFSF